MAISAKTAELLELQQGRSRAEVVAGQTDDDSFVAFRTWLESLGADLGACELRPCGDDAGNGLVAAAPISQGAVLASIPEQAYMSTETCKAASIGEFCSKDQLVSLMPNVALALHLLTELHARDSPWKAYIRVLPRTYSVPLYWKNDELQMLKGSPAFLEALNLHRHVARQYAYFHRALRDKTLAASFGFPAGRFTFADYRWAVATVQSRQNRVPVRPAQNAAAAAVQPVWTLALVPWWDMINHERGQATTEADPNARLLRCTASRDYAAGEQVFMHYGDRSNAEFVVHQGFFAGEHENDEVSVRLGVAQADVLHAKKAELLSALSLPVKGDFFVYASGEIDPQLRAFVRIVHMDSATLTAHLQDPARCASLGAPEGIVSSENETAAINFLRVRISLLLKVYPTSAEDDRQILEEDAETYAEKLAVRLRMSEKKILARALESLTAKTASA